MTVSRPGYMQTRSLEAGLALMMVTCGFQLHRHGDTFGAPIYAILKTFMNEDTGGAVMIWLGFTRLVSLIVNGNITATPILRFVGCALGFAFWLTFAIAIAGVEPQPGVANPILVPITATFAALEFYSGIRTMVDASTLDSFFLQRLAHRRRTPVPPRVLRA